MIGGKIGALMSQRILKRKNNICSKKIEKPQSVSSESSLEQTVKNSDSMILHKEMMNARILPIDI